VHPPGCSGASSRKLSAGAAAHAARWCRAKGSRKPLSIWRWPAYGCKASKSASARGSELCVLLWITSPSSCSTPVRSGSAVTIGDVYSPIVNAHFRCAVPPGSPYFIGMVGGSAEWIFRKQMGLSVTVSAADKIVDQSAEELRDLLWRDAALAYRLPVDPVPPARIVKERRATFLASPAQLLRRPPTTTRWMNLLLAGDYVDTGLPAAIEGAIDSGLMAAARATEAAGAPVISNPQRSNAWRRGQSDGVPVHE